jgi:hypothetical protein
VSRIFKTASIAADEAVEGDLRGVQELLLSQVRLSQIAKDAELACFRAFDAQLDTFPWAKKTPKYATVKTQVRKDSLQARVARFSTAHEKRLRAHLQTGLQNSLALYKERVSSIHMPASEADIDTQIEQVVKASRELFMGYGQEVSDTSAFKETDKHFRSSMEEGRRQLQEKNVELWKVYSDGATRCAAALNSQRSANCSVLCLFNNIPWVHKAGSRRHLQECFAKDSGSASARMSPQLQAQVFEVWYSKDVGQAAGTVSTRFTMLWVTFVLVIATIWWHRRGRRYWYTYPGVRSSYNPYVWQPGGYSMPCQGGLQGVCYPQQQPYFPQQGYSSSMPRRRPWGIGGA